MKIATLFFLTIFSSVIALGQQTRRIITGDTLALWEVRKVAHPLALDSNQAKLFLLATKTHQHELEKIRTLNLADSSRMIAVREAGREFKRQLKTILSKAQLAKYKAIQEETKEAFRLSHQQSKISIKSIDDNSY